MNKLIVLATAATLLLFSCNQPSTKKVIEVEEHLTEAKEALKKVKSLENEAAKEKEIAEWNSFKSEADSSITAIEKDLTNWGAQIEKDGKKDKQKLKTDYEKAKNDLQTLKEKLHTRNVEFKNDMNTIGKNISEQNQSFRREFKHDMDEFGKTFKDFFKDNVK
jgi:DNA anti-recombination protein RmuC